MNKKSISEKLRYSTVLIETESGRGTGFFFSHFCEGKEVLIIITNKHVVNYKNIERVKINLHLEDNDENINKNIIFEDNLYWFPHPNKDLCFCYAAPIINKVAKENQRKVFLSSIVEELIYSDEQLNQLDAVEEVLMVGYPIGLSDIKNNYPIFRRGITSSHPASSFNEEGIGLVDLAAFPGSSGSPIFIANQGNYKDKQGNIFVGQSRIIFLGVLFAGPVFNIKGELEIKEIPTKQGSNINVPMMINLGYYIKANEINEFKKQIDETVKNHNL